MDPLTTPDGRYLIVRGRLWRATDPSLSEQERQRLVNELMDARRAVKAAKASEAPTPWQPLGRRWRALKED